MLFSSLSFVFRFLPVFLIVYYFCPAKGKNFVLAIGSLIFYGLGEPRYIILMIMSILVNYLIARGLQRCHRIEKPRLKAFLRGILLITGCLYNVGLLIVFKYLGFILGTIENIFSVDFGFPYLSLPLGISFYTFQILSYVVDVFRGEVSAETNIIDLGAYLFMFPQLIAGPIVVYKDVQRQLKNPEHRGHLRDFDDGLKLFTIGLASKVLLANRFGQIWDTMAEIGYDNLSTPVAWLGIAAYTMQIYFDFNGYSLMAIGLGKILGFEFPRNFNSPYIAKSVSDFWRRWHMTLTSFFRNYIYIPLGGNRRGFVCTLINMLIVWLITGIWHGADWNFVLWGLYYFIILAVERILKMSPLGVVKEKLDMSSESITGSVLNFILEIPFRVYSLVAIMVGWCIFAITDLQEIGVYLSRLFAPVMGLTADGLGAGSFSTMMYVWYIVGAIFATPVFVGIYERKKSKPVVSIILLVLFWLSIVQLVDSAYNPFLYFRF